MADELESQPTVKPKMNFRQKEFMLAHILRLPSVFDHAKAMLKPEHFDPIEDPHYALVWKSALDIAEQCGGKLPKTGARIRIEMDAAAAFDAAATSFPFITKFKDELFGENGFLVWAYSLAESEMNETDGFALLAKFLEERDIIEPLCKALATVGEGGLPTNLSDLLDNLRGKLGQINTIGVDPMQSAFPEDWSPKPVNIFPTGINFLDVMMGGGQAPGEVYLLLGPTSGGKTTLGVQIAVQGALYQQMTYPDPKEMGHWFIFTYESPVDPELRFRVWSHSAGIHRDSLWKMKSLSELSTSATLKPYELLKYSNELATGVQILGERERLAAARAKLEKNLWLVDMSGADPANPKVGTGGIDEIARYLARKADSGVKIAGYVIDYAGIAVDRQMAEHKIKDEHKRIYLNRFVRDCVVKLSAPFNAAGWVLHQLSGVANSRSAASALKHTDAAECRTMADAAWFAFTLGTKDYGTSACRITCSKTRRVAGDNNERLVIIDGTYCTMIANDGQFAIDPRTKKIVNADDLKKIRSGRPGPVNDLVSAVKQAHAKSTDPRSAAFLK